MQTPCQLTNTYKNKRLPIFPLRQSVRRCRNQIDEPAETQETRVIWHWGVLASGEAAMQQ
jgi:hypothetical protein